MKETKVSDSSTKKFESEEELKKFVDKNFYKIRECASYKAEYDECTSLKGKFFQYFVHGHTLDCSQWKNVFEDCQKAFMGSDIDRQALARVIEHEDKRMEQRIQANLNNDVWEKRETPPENWNKELPEWLQERQKNAYEGLNIDDEEEEKSCIIF